MGIAQHYKEQYEGLQFYLVHQVDGLAEYKSDVICVPEHDLEVLVKIIVSLKDNFKMPQEMFIGDIYKTAEKIHDISQYKLIPLKTHTIYNCLQQ